MADTSWAPVIGAVTGAVIALAGTLVNTLRTDRTQRSRDRESERLKTYIDFAQALEKGHSALRTLARSEPDDPSRVIDSGEAVYAADVYSIRERLLMSGTPTLVAAGETAFARLISIRDTVRTGATLSGQPYHQAYHDYAEALWNYRVAARQELGQRPLDPAELGRSSWSEREQCPRCHSTETPA